MTQKRADHLGQDVAASLARLLEIPRQVAESGGERALTAMIAIKHAIDAGSGGLRMNYLADAQKHIARIDPARHGRLIQHLQANVVALGGRGGDREIAHVTPGEIVIPQRLQTPAVIDALRAEATHAGIDLESLQIGSGRNSINPHTGQMEFNDGDTRPKTDWGDRVRPGERIGPQTPPPDTRPGGPSEDIQARPDQHGKPATSIPILPPHQWHTPWRNLVPRLRPEQKNEHDPFIVDPTNPPPWLDPKWLNPKWEA